MTFRTTVAAVFGGMAAKASGGNFAQGAKTAAIQHLFNEELSELAAQKVRYGKKIKSSRAAEQAEIERQQKLGRSVVSGRVSASYDGDGYIRGREFDAVATDKSGHYFLTEVKYRNPNFRPQGRIGKFIQVANIVNTARQLNFDLNLDQVTLSGNGIPGGEIMLDAGQYTVNWIVVRPSGTGTSYNASNTQAMQDMAEGLFQ